VVPPGGRYFFELEGVQFETFTMSDLLAKVRRFAKSKDIEIPADLEPVVVDYMCRKLPEDFCYGDLDGRGRSRTVTMNQLKENTLEKLNAAGNTRVLIPEATRRAVTCAGCDRNDRTLCPTCVGMIAWARRQTRRNLGVKEDWVGVCAVDAVILAAMLHIDDKNPEGEFPEHCWRKK
jgi:hypothetical protein